MQYRNLLPQINRRAMSSSTTPHDYLSAGFLYMGNHDDDLKAVRFSYNPILSMCYELRSQITSTSTEYLYVIWLLPLNTGDWFGPNVKLHPRSIVLDRVSRYSVSLFQSRFSKPGGHHTVRRHLGGPVSQLHLNDQHSIHSRVALHTHQSSGLEYSCGL